MQPDRPYPLPVRITYRVMSWLVILAAAVVTWSWLATLADFPLLLLVMVGIAWGAVASSAAHAVETPVVGWAMRTAHRLVEVTRRAA